jgi:deoxycytidylate deaminase
MSAVLFTVTLGAMTAPYVVDNATGVAFALRAAVADAARRGSSVEGCVAYVTHFPCINCAKILAAAGIAEVKYRSDYHNDPLVTPLLADAGVKVLKL